MFWSGFGYRTNSLWLACVLLVSVGGGGGVGGVCVYAYVIMLLS